MMIGRNLKEDLAAVVTGGATVLLLAAAPHVVSDGSISGTVSFSGDRPAPEAISVRQDREACGEEITVTKVAGEGTAVANTLIRLVDVESTATPDFGEPVLDQTGCEFAPQIVLVAPGQELTVLNSDGILHNVHTRSRANRSVNRSMPKFLKELKVEFREPEIIPVKCDVHSWMQAYIVVAEHQYYAVTDANGAFTLPNVPDGTYTLEAWHPELGTRTTEVQVTGGQVEASITF